MRLIINWPGKSAETLDWPDHFTFAEMRLVKRTTGLRPGEIQEAIETRDPDVVIAYTAVALQRAHPLMSYRDISDALDSLQFGSIDVDTDPEDEEQTGPPADAGETGEPGQNETQNGDDSAPQS